MLSQERIVSFSPSSHGFGFSVFSTDHELIDWGHVHVRPARHDKCLERMWGTLTWYAPTVVAIETTGDSSSRRGKRVEKLLDALAEMIDKTSELRMVRFSKDTVRQAFEPSGNITKQQMADLVAAYFTELRFQLPPPRKIWMSEDERMSIFESAALAMVFMYGRIYEDEIR